MNFHNRINRSFLLFFAVIFFNQCSQEMAEVPKPRAYPRVLYPVKDYALFDKNYCNFTFECPKYAEIVQDTSFFETRPSEPCWFNIDVPALSAEIHCSYRSIDSKNRLDLLVNDAYKMAQKHTQKASFIDEIPVNRPKDRVYGVVMDIQGPAASAYQFYVTDSTRHFLRGALYFNTQARPDSLAPVIEFMKQDVNKMVETLIWNK